jgi:hypothetical protein
MELFVGDIEGYLSRWANNRLDQLPQNDVAQLLKSYAVHDFNRVI